MGFTFTPKGKVDIPEIDYKDSIDLSPENTALIIVDMQNDFVKPGGSLHVDAASEITGSLQDLIAKSREAGVKIFYTQDTHSPDDKEFTIWPAHCIKNTNGWEIVAEIAPEANDIIIEKNRYDGFYATPLEHYLRSVYSIDNLIIVGTVSNICVAQTAASAGLRWFNIITPADCTAAITEFDQAATLRQISWLFAGNVLKSYKGINFVG